MRPFAKNLRNIRMAKGWSQTVAARHLGIPRSKYASYEEDRAAPSLELLSKMCSVFGITDLLAFISDLEDQLVDPPSFIERKYNSLPPRIRKAVGVLMEIE